MLIGKNLSALGKQKIFKQNGLLQQVMKQLRKANILSKEEEDLLFDQYKHGDMEARNKIILSNQGIVFGFAKQYSTDEDELMDYFIEGIGGLIDAMDKYNPEYGVKFYTYASHYIRRSMYYYFTRVKDTVRQAGKYELGNKPSVIKEKFYAKNGFYPDNETLIELLQEEYSLINGTPNINITNDMMVSNQFISTDCVVDGDDYTFEETDEYNSATSVSNEAEDDEDREYAHAAVLPLLKFLSRKERELIMKLYGIGKYSNYTRREVIDEYFITDKDLTEIENNILYKMRECAAKLTNH